MRNKPLSSLTRAIELREDYAEAHSSLAAVLNILNRSAEAKVSASRALQLDPELAEAWINLGNAGGQTRDLSAVEAAHRQSIKANPANASGYYNLGNTLADMWQQTEAIRYFRKALEISPGFENAQDNLLLNLLYDPNATEASLLHESMSCEKQLSLTSAQADHNNVRQPDRPLHIGYVSPDFRISIPALISKPCSDITTERNLLSSPMPMLRSQIKQVVGFRKWPTTGTIYRE